MSSDAIGCVSGARKLFYLTAGGADIECGAEINVVLATSGIWRFIITRFSHGRPNLGLEADPVLTSKQCLPRHARFEREQLPLDVDSSAEAG